VATFYSDMGHSIISVASCQWQLQTVKSLKYDKNETMVSALSAVNSLSVVGHLC